MSQFIQSLENRVLMSVTSQTLTADAAAVVTQTVATRAALTAFKGQDAALGRSVAGALKSADTKSNRAANNKLVAILTRAGNHAYAKIQSAENALISAAKSHSLMGAAHGKALLLHPTKSAIQKSVNKDIATLNSLIPAKLAVLQSALSDGSAAVNTAFTNIATANPSVAATIQAGQANASTAGTAFSAAANQIETDTAQLATDLTFPVALPTLATLTDVTLFRGDTNGENQDTQGSAIAHGAWSTELDVQNVPGNYGAELFISKVANPTAADFLSPGALAAALHAGTNTFYFFADGDDTLGGSDTFGLNLFIDGADATTPSISAFTAPGTGQTLNPDSAATTAGANFVVAAGSGKLVTPTDTGAVLLTSFVVQGVSGQGSTVDLVNSTNTAPFTPPAQPDNIPDTYGMFTITVS